MSEPEHNPALGPELDVAAKPLFAARTVLIFGEITARLAQTVTAQLMALANENQNPIRVLVNSPGGHVESGDTIRDVLRFVPAEIHLIATGWVASAAALIYTGTDRSKRFALPNTRFMLHQPSGGARGQASDIEIEAEQILAVRARLNRIFSEATGRSLEQIQRETERNHWLTAVAARDYGLVGHIIESEHELRAALGGV